MQNKSNGRNLHKFLFLHVRLIFRNFATRLNINVIGWLLREPNRHFLKQILMNNELLFYQTDEVVCREVTPAFKTT